MNTRTFSAAAILGMMMLAATPGVAQQRGDESTVGTTVLYKTGLFDRAWPTYRPAIRGGVADVC